MPDHPGQVPAHFQRRLHPAVGIAEEPDVLHAHALRRGHLLGLAQGRHPRARERLIKAVGLAIGHDAVGHVDPGFRPSRHGPRGAEIHVVGMRGDGKDPGDLGVIEHTRYPRQDAAASREAWVPGRPVT